jgi:protein associated with RNAse G/E
VAAVDAVMDPISVHVRSCKFDGTVHRTWTARLVERTEHRIVLEGEFESEVRHPLLGTIERGAQTREIFWTDRWYSVFQFLHGGGGVRLHYVNINLPPTLNGSELTFIDLDIDLLIQADGTYSILDEDEFQTNAELFNYPAELRARVHRTVAELSKQIKTGHFREVIDSKGRPELCI